MIEAEFKKLLNRFNEKIALDEKLMGNIIEKLFEEEDYRLDKICSKIMKNRMLEGYYVKKMSNEAKFLEETEEKVFRMTNRIMNATCWNHQKKLSLLEEKLKAQKLESENKINE